MDVEPHVEDLLRQLAPQTLAVLTRRYSHFDLAEDAVQEALLAAATAWSTAVPDNPAGWLTTVATRRLTDLLRSEQARRRREQTEATRRRSGSVDWCGACCPANPRLPGF